jgi:hypothetical protein
MGAHYERTLAVDSVGGFAADFVAAVQAQCHPSATGNESPPGRMELAIALSMMKR